MTTPVADPTNGAAPGEPPPPWLEELPPRKIVEALNRFIVGQDAAKKAVAIAIRNRWRRSQAPDGIRDEITPYNIIMIGPTGVGKTEVARRLARLAGAPFVKVEASKFTEVGYVGRDAESMVRELVDAAISMVRTEREDEVWPQAEQRADERLLDILLPPPPPKPEATGSEKVFVVGPAGGAQPESVDADASRQRSREKLRQLLLDGIRNAVLRQLLADGAVQAFGGRTVVAPDVEDDRVVQSALALDLGDDPARVVVGVLGEAGEDLHQPALERSLGLGDRLPGSHRGGTRRELCVLRNPAHGLGTFEGALAILVPAVVELAFVLVGPLFRDLVRAV
mgnify:CR=1 FL=1